MSSFLGGKLHGAFGQPAFFLVGNRITIVALGKRGFFISLSLFKIKRLFDSIEVLKTAFFVGNNIFEEFTPSFRLTRTFLSLLVF